jgi:putative endonuclease
MQYGGTVYILTNKINTVLYIGVTTDLHARICEHREKVDPNSFTAKYNCYKLLYYESFSRIEEAITREKQMKKWKREWKEKLIAVKNPNWIDLFDEI